MGKNRKMVIKAEVVLPDDDFAAARIVAKMEPAIEALQACVSGPGATVSHSIVSVRGPNKKPVPLHPMAVVHSGDDAA